MNVGSKGEVKHLLLLNCSIFKLQRNWFKPIVTSPSPNPAPITDGWRRAPHLNKQPIYRHPRHGDVYGALISYRREVGGRSITVNRHLNQLYPFIGVEKYQPQEQTQGLSEDGAAENLAPETGTHIGEAQDEFHIKSSDNEH